MALSRVAAALLAALLTVATPGALPQAQAQEPVVTPPELLEDISATLPADTPRVNLEIKLVITIGVDGSATEVTTEGAPDGFEVYLEAALAAARQFRFKPATVDGEAVPVRVPYTYTFSKPARRGSMVPARQKRRPLIPAPGYYYVGELQERGTRKPLAGIAVMLSDSKADRIYEGITDDDGMFLIYGLPAGKLSLTVITSGYKDRSDIVEGEALPIDAAEAGGGARALTEEQREPRKTIYLTPSQGSGYRTVVQQKRRPSAASEITLSEEELTQVPGTFGDPTRVVQSLPGVARSPFGLGYYIVRGASFENTGFFIDGHPAYNLYHLAGGPGVIHPELVGQLDFYPGGYPAKFGRYSAGAISITTKDPPNDTWHVELSIDVFRASLLASIPFDDGKGQVTASFRQSYYELLLPLIQEGITVRYTDYQFRTKYELAPGYTLRFAALGSVDVVGTEDIGGDGGSAVGSQNDLQIQFHRLLLGFDAQIDTSLMWHTSAVWEYDETSTRSAIDGNPELSASLAGWFLSMRTYLDWKPLDELRLEIGVDGLYVEAGAKLQVPLPTALGDPRPPAFDPVIGKFDVEGPISSTGLYISADIEPVKGLRIIPGVRLNLETYSGGLWVTGDPKLAVRWEFVPNWTLKASAGLAHQLPSPFQSGEPFGNPNLPPIEAFQASLGLEFDHEDGWFASVEGFYNYSDKLIGGGSTGTVTEDGEITSNFFEANVDGRAYGLEVLLRKKIGGPVYGWISYTLSRSERLRPPNTEWETYEIDQTHVFSLALTVKLPNEWSIGGRFSLSSGNPYYPVTGSYYDADRDRYAAVRATTPSRIQPFHRLDLRIDKTIRFTTWLFQIYLDIQNVYNANNPEALRYSYDFRAKADGISLPILPTIGIKAVF